MGLEFRESSNILSAKNEATVRPGMVFNVCVAVSGLDNPAAKDAKGKVYALQVRCGVLWCRVWPWSVRSGVWGEVSPVLHPWNVTIVLVCVGVAGWLCPNEHLTTVHHPRSLLRPCETTFMKTGGTQVSMLYSCSDLLLTHPSNLALRRVVLCRAVSPADCRHRGGAQ